MKYKEMEIICKQQKNICKNCPLNCIEDFDVWNKEKPTWCFKKLRERYENKYRMYKERGHDQEAEMCMQEYLSMEQKYLIKK